MGLGNLFKSLFGGGSANNAAKKGVDAEPVEYKGFRIYAEPASEGGQYRTAGRIVKDIDGQAHETRFIRADNNTDLQSSIDHCVRKAKQIIDEQGDALLKKDLI